MGLFDWFKKKKILYGANTSCRTQRNAMQFSKVQTYFNIQKALLRQGFLLCI